MAGHLAMRSRLGYNCGTDCGTILLTETSDVTMFVFDLRWLLFGFLAMLIVTSLLATCWERWRRGHRETMILGMDQVPAALEQAPIGLLVLQSPDAYRYANAQARQFLDLAGPAGSLPGEEWVSRLKEDREVVRQERGAGGRYHSVLLAPERAIGWWIVPWGNRDVVFLLDVAAQQRAEQAADHLLSDLSHELRTPLATILTHLEVLLLPDISTEIGQQSLHLLKAETRRMARLVNDMLELGRLESSAEIERRPLDLLGVVKQIIDLITPQAQERGIGLALEVAAPLPLVVGDEYRLQQVFLNLLDNVVKHCRPGDRATVSLGREGEGVVCTVHDNGPGIPAKDLPYVTRRFYRGTPQGEGGSGLGLSLVAEILRHHGSRLELDSPAEGDETGTRVRFVLPILLGEEEE